jgi:CspA family cold shock protein
MTTATVREWHPDLGWGVLDSADTPGGCWTHFSDIESRAVGSVDGAEVHEYRSLSVGEVVELEWEAPGQDGFDYRAVTVRRRA